MAADRAIRIHDLGLGYRHPVGFTVDRPRGSGDCLLLQFQTPTLIRLRGRVAHASAGSCLIYTPAFPQWYRGDGVGLENDWVHFDRSAASLLRRLRAPLNRPFTPASPTDVPVALAEVHREWTRRDRHWVLSCSLLLQRLFVLLAREPDRRGPAATPRMTELHDALARLRTRIASSPEAAWTVSRMAEEVHLSRSRFATLFPRFFRQSPMDCVIDARIARARWHLRHTTLPVKQVAQLCGFESPAYFSRAFRQRVGCSPRAFQARG